VEISLQILIMKKIFKLLSEPYPMKELGLRDMLLAVLSGIFVMGYLVFFNPTGPLTSSSMLVKLLGYALITTLFVLFNAFVIKNLLQLILKAEYWTLGKQFIWYCYVIAVIGFLNYYYSNSLELYQFSLQDHIFSAFAFGALLFGFFLAFNFNYLSNKYGKRAGVLNKLLKSKEVKTDKVFTFNNGQSEKLQLPENDLSYVQKCRKGAKLFYIDKGNPVSEVISEEFSAICKKIRDSNILQCHPDYLINIDNLEQIKGTAQGYRLKFYLQNNKVPVSKEYRNVIRDYLSR
jgi:hypothetical protein